MVFQGLDLRVRFGYPALGNARLNGNFCSDQERIEMLEQIKQEIAKDIFYQQNFPNDGQRFIAWYLRRVLLLSPVAARDAITDGADDKQIDAVVVDDEDDRI